MRIGEHEIEPLAPKLYDARYILRSNRDASQAWVEVYDPLLNRIAGPVNGPVHALPQDAVPKDIDWNHAQVSADLQYASDQPYRFVFWARDNFPDYDKAHQRKVALANQGVINLGWCLSAGFLFQQLPDVPWSRWSLVPVDTRTLADQVKAMVDKVAVPDPKRPRTILQGMYRTDIVVRGVPENLLYKSDAGAVTFQDKINKAVSVQGSGLIHYAGHGGGGSLIAFPDNDPQPTYIFGLCGAWRGDPTMCVDISLLPPLGNVRIVYLGACKTCSDQNGTGLVAAFVKKGAHAAVGWHVSLVAWPWNAYDKDKAFWKTLVGDLHKKKPGGTVSDAAYWAARTFKGWWRTIRGKWRNFVGLAGNPGETLY